MKKYVIDSRNQLKYILWSVEEVSSLDSWDERAGTFSEVSAESCADHSLQRKLTLKSQTIRNRLQVIERFKQKPARLTSITPVIPQTSADGRVITVVPVYCHLFPAGQRCSNNR